jgi:hypothetical protein
VNADSPPRRRQSNNESERRRVFMEYKNSFVLYESVYAQYERLMQRGKV